MVRNQYDYGCGTQPYFELEVDGEVVARAYQYSTIRRKAATYLGEYKIYWRRRSRGNNSRATPFDPLMVEQAWKLRQEGKSWHQIGQKLEVLPASIKAKVRYEYGVVKKEGPPRLTNEDLQAMLRMRNNKLTYKEIADLYNRSMSTIYNFINDKKND